MTDVQQQDLIYCLPNSTDTILIPAADIEAFIPTKVYVQWTLRLDRQDGKPILPDTKLGQLFTSWVFVYGDEQHCYHIDGAWYRDVIANIPLAKWYDPQVQQEAGRTERIYTDRANRKFLCLKPAYRNQ